jgi:hypothetical protein
VKYSAHALDTYPRMKNGVGTNLLQVLLVALASFPLTSTTNKQNKQQSRGTNDLRGYTQKLNQSLNKLNVFLSHPDLKDVPFENVLLLSAVISEDALVPNCLTIWTCQI